MGRVSLRAGHALVCCHPTPTRSRGALASRWHTRLLRPDTSSVRYRRCQLVAERPLPPGARLLATVRRSRDPQTPRQLAHRILDHSHLRTALLEKRSVLVIPQPGRNPDLAPSSDRLGDGIPRPASALAPVLSQRPFGADRSDDDHSGEPHDDIVPAHRSPARPRLVRSERRDEQNPLRPVSERSTEFAGQFLLIQPLCEHRHRPATGMSERTPERCTVDTSSESGDGQPATPSAFVSQLPRSPLSLTARVTRPDDGDQPIRRQKLEVAPAEERRWLVVLRPFAELGRVPRVIGNEFFPVGHSARRNAPVRRTSTYLRKVSSRSTGPPPHRPCPANEGVFSTHRPRLPDRCVSASPPAHTPQPHHPLRGVPL
jgi:hypothetical protein